MSPRDAADLEWPLSEGMQVSALPPVWIAMTISCWSVKLLKLPSVTLTHVCGTNSHNWWAKGLPGVGVGVVKIFCDSDSNSSGWKSFRLRLHSPACPRPVVLDLFYISYPFIEQDYQIYPQYTQWCSFIENTKWTNSYSSEWFMQIYISCNLWFSKFTPLEDEIYPQGTFTPG